MNINTTEDWFRFIYHCINHSNAQACDRLLKSTQADYIIKTFLNCQNYRGRTALFEATRNGNIELVQALVAVGADVNKADNDDMTPLGFLLMLGEMITQRSLELFKILVEAGANIYLNPHRKLSPLNETIKFGEYDKANILIQNHALCFEDLAFEGDWPAELQVLPNTISISLKINGKEVTNATPGFESAITTPGALLEAIKQDKISPNIIEQLKNIWRENANYLNDRDEKNYLEVAHIFRYAIPEVVDTTQRKADKESAMPGLVAKCLNYINFRKENDLRLKAHELRQQDSDEKLADTTLGLDAYLRQKIAPY
jgi:hypothetical protein